MKLKLTRHGALVAALALAGAASALAAGTLTIYQNTFSSRSAMQQMRHVKGRHCPRSLFKAEMVVKVGQHTPECVYRAPVTGKRISISAAVAISKQTPSAKRGRAFEAVWLHAGNGGKYEFAIHSSQQKWFLRRYEPPSNTFTEIAHGKVLSGAHKINGVGKRNRLKLTFAAGGSVVARVNSKLVKQFTDSNASQISGQDVMVAIGSDGSGVNAANGVVGIFDNIIVQVPDPLSP
jgi:hypothetical protein